ncbi:chorismate transformation enzyme, FkbO/Hyg5 family [Imhoffiella purpurea]|uniref:Chorismatase FkbO/Hyg5-like N-terminal domain-containing protein n=1 Tax=Imhoffiella purpurea TaxID=1249627 RepID=W9V9V7_9GAMM|nr:hypothetical protein [Imhoffiella purpurea]EXJ16239.1 hypothetical protein D779_0381 [Imhoffiella purpurea]
MILTYRLSDSVGDDPIAPSTFARIRFAERHARSSDPRDLVIGLPPLSRGAAVEEWHAERLEDLGWDGDTGFVEGDGLMLVHRLIQEEEPDRLARTTERLYGELLALIAQRGYPHPLRMWNFIERIHDPADGQERYRAFSAGRVEAFDRAGFERKRIPAASAIGTSAGGLLVYALASRTPGEAVENPRQIPAYRYPPRYGVRPPYFARAMRGTGGLAGTLFISGTASVVGHASCHPERLEPQLTETLLNLETLIETSGETRTRRPDLLRVYVRAPHGIEGIESRLRDWCGPEPRIQYLRGDICRRGLEVEIEGVLQPCAAPS